MAATKGCTPSARPPDGPDGPLEWRLCGKGLLACGPLLLRGLQCGLLRGPAGLPGQLLDPPGDSVGLLGGPLGLLPPLLQLRPHLCAHRLLLLVGLLLGLPLLLLLQEKLPEEELRLGHILVAASSRGLRLLL